MKRLLNLNVLPVIAALAVLAAYLIDQAIGNAGIPLVMAATLGLNGKVTLLDIAKAMDPNGNTADVAELLMQTNEILLDMPFYEANQPTSHKSTIRTGLPTAVWRQFYRGVPPSKSQRAQVEDAIGMLEARSEVDIDIAKLNGNTASFRLSEARAFVEAMNQRMAHTVFYGNSITNPERFNGLTPRYNALTGSEISENVLSAGGGSTDNVSVWLVGWGADTVFGTYPKGSVAGLQHKDLGEIDAFDSDNNRYRAYADWWQWKCGLVVKDWRYVVRIPNIDKSDLIAQTTTQAPTAATAIMKLMIRAMARIPFPGMVNCAFYAPRLVKEMLAVAALDKSNSALKIVESANQFGAVRPGYTQTELQFFGVPVRTCDALQANETAVS